MKKQTNITESEWPIMKVLWEKPTATAAEIVAFVTSENSSSMRTVKTLIRRLIAKNAVGFTVDENDSRIYHYRALISKEESVQARNQSLLNLVYENRAGDMLIQFLKSSRLSKNEIEDLQRILKEKEREYE